jgi:hypothetical protein
MQKETRDTAPTGSIKESLDRKREECGGDMSFDISQPRQRGKRRREPARSA